MTLVDQFSVRVTRGFFNFDQIVIIISGSQSLSFDEEILPCPAPALRKLVRESAMGRACLQLTIEPQVVTGVLHIFGILKRKEVFVGLHAASEGLSEAPTVALDSF